MADSQQAIKATIKRATIEAQRSMDKLDADGIKRVENLYKQAAEDIQKRIDLYTVIDDNIALRDMQNLLVHVRQRLDILSAARDSLLDSQLISAAKLGVQPFEQVLLTPNAANAVAADALRFVRNFVAENGLQLSDRIWRLDRQAKDYVVNAIENAVIQGYGATQAAREFLTRGEPVPLDVQNKVNMANGKKIGKEIITQLTASGSPMDNAMRLFRTEINRAHGEAYIESALSHPDAAGIRYKLSPSHPRPDICDLHSTANLYGLGPGVYPTREKCPWPAHPNILSYVEIVFKDEVSEQDKAGKETPLEALARLSPAQQIGALGKNKYELFLQGGLKEGMIKSQWRSVKRRIDIPIKEVKPVAPVKKPSPEKPKAKSLLQLDDYILAGKVIADDLLDKAKLAQGYDAETFVKSLYDQLKSERSLSTPAKVETSGIGADYVRAASQVFPDDWTKLADKYGPLYVKYSTSRGGQISVSKDWAGIRYQGYLGFSGVFKGGDGFIRTGSFSTSVHEYAHRLQHAIPGLDDIFQELHGRRTDGDPLKKLRNLYPGYNYGRDEVAREDKYRSKYQGKVYSGHPYLGKYGALEVMTMAFEDVLGGQRSRLQELIEVDREMLNLVVGLLFKYVP